MAGNLLLQAFGLAVNWGIEKIGKSKPVTLRDVMPEYFKDAPPAPQPAEVSTPVPTVSHGELVAYQNHELVKEMVLLEAHLLQGCKIAGKPCDCCQKHPIAVEGLAREGLQFTGKSLYSEIAGFAQTMEPITTPEASGSGKFDAQYPQMAAKLRELRKRVMIEAAT
jgi:hypothetical protein